MSARFLEPLTSDELARVSRVMDSAMRAVADTYREWEPYREVMHDLHAISDEALAEMRHQAVAFSARHPVPATALSDVDAAQAAWEAECDAMWWETCRHMAAAGLLGPDAWLNPLPATVPPDSPDVPTSGRQDF
jgi:hypothetical protein